METEIKCDAKNEALLEKRHRLIAEAAAPLFIKKGFHQTTMREIARAVGMSMGNLYHYINSKDDVLFLVYRQLYAIWETHLEKYDIKNVEDPVEKLRLLMLSMLRAAYEFKDLTQMTFRESKFLEKSALNRFYPLRADLSAPL